ncbi:MAG: cysteine--tRNA ligase [Lachnospiraceae bacterium]|jgi:cysteinyl-tRNA synthetase|nr:cysteine--tRNA ligase [Lachnospiraceae bacterium]MCI1327447.1 cysteine--tRNA ligase [Lachnospiraceae bacterium]
MKLYNTMTKRKEEFVPITPGKISMYVCGPTVYNLIHIGNARPMIVFDTARRYFEYKGYEVNYVSNFTDVDDKIIKKANEEGVTAEEISSRYIAECKKDMEAMNVRPATTHPLATNEIPGMIEMITKLIEQGHAYEVNGTVYFRTRSFPEYGKLSHKNLDDLRSGFRDLKVSGEDQKEDPLDFVLWKPKKEGEPYWDAPWSQGRPGWHIECSVMAKHYLGETIDIHAGGEDLIFPHHENEIAQSECCNGAPFAHYWLHNAFLNIDNRKMSKSLGNFFTVREIGEQYDLMVLRMFMLSAHYRSPLNFSREIMESAKNSLERIVTAADRLNDLIAAAQDQDLTEDEKKKLEEMKPYRLKFEQAMDDDLNTADALAAVFELVRFANVEVSEGASRLFAEMVKQELLLLCDILGLTVERRQETLDEEIEAKIAERQEARKAKDFARADAIRDELLAKGIILEDTREGVKWKRA